MTLFNNTALFGKTFIVTGASSGLGRGVATALSQLGGEVLILGRNENRLNDTLLALSGSGHQMCTGDLSSADAAYDTLKAARGLVDTGVDGIFHSAGIASIKMARMARTKHIDDIMGASLFGAMGVARAAGSKGFFNVAGGSLVFMSSVAGERGQIGMSTYGASRAAISGLVKSLACEFAGQAIRVNSIIAGAVETEMHDQISRGMDENSLKDYEDKHLLGFGSTDDIANCALFLMSNASKWMTGSSVLVDGGYMAK